MVIRFRALTFLALSIAPLIVAPLVGTPDSDPATGVLIALDTKSGNEVWRTSTPGIFRVEDVSNRVVAGRGFACTNGPFRTLAYRARDGKQLWQAPAGDSSPSSRGAETLATGSARSGVILSTTAKKVRGLDAMSGHERWSVPVAHTPQVATDAQILVIAEPGAAFGDRVRGVARALDRATGKQLWSRSVADADVATAVVGSGAVGVGFTRQVVSGIDVRFPSDARVLAPRTGRERWSIDDLVPGLVAESVIAFSEAPTGYTTGLVVLDAATGERLWERSSSPYGMWPMGTRLGLQEADRFSVVDARTGTVVWDRPVATGRTIAVSESEVVLADRTTVTLLDANTGEPRWQSTPLSTDTETFNSVALAGDRLYVAVGCSYSD